MKKSSTLQNKHRIPLKKYSFPVCQKIPGYQFDIEALIRDAENFESKFVDVVSANKKFCTNNPHLVEDVYDHFEQVTLTEHLGNSVFDGKRVFKNEGKADNNCSKALSSHAEACKSKTHSYRMKSRRLKELDPALDERNYSNPTSDYIGSYFEKVVNSFKSQAIRVRLTKLKAGTKITPHIDYDPSYAVRVIIPIVSHQKIINQFWFRGECQEYHLKADGSAYFLNTGFRHAVINKSDTDRVCLMFSLLGQEDISSLALC